MNTTCAAFTILTCMDVQFIFIDDVFFFIQETYFDDTEVNVYVCLLDYTM